MAAPNLLPAQLREMLTPLLLLLCSLVLGLEQTGHVMGCRAGSGYRFSVSEEESKEGMV